MIDISTETVLTLTEAAKRLPQRRRGSRPHPATLFRWVQRGIKGVRLECLQVAGTKCTSIEALQRFFERLSDPRQPDLRTRPDRQRQIDKAERECDRAGI